jgi:hypothetical protein
MAQTVTEPAPSPPDPPPVKLDNQGVATVIALTLAIGVVLTTLASAIPAPVLAHPLALGTAAAELGYFLGRWGLALILVGFVPLQVTQLMRAFVRQRTTLAADEVVKDPWKQLIDSIPNLIKTPIGVGMALILVGVFLLLGASATSNDTHASPTATPTAVPQ